MSRTTPNRGCIRRLLCEALESRQLLSINTTTAFLSVPTDGVYGEELSISVQVSSESTENGMPTGTVTLLDGDTVLDTEPVADNGAVAFSLGSLSVGSHTITVMYSGDDTFSASTSSEAALDVTRANTSTALDASSESTTYGDSITFTAMVSVVLPGSGIPSGTVTFLDGAQVLGTTEVAADGTADFTTTALSAGSHVVSAIYDGDGRFLESVASQIDVNVGQATLTVAADNLTRVYGQAEPTLTYQITGFQNGDDQNAISGEPILSAANSTDSAPGEYLISVDLNSLSASNYSFVAADGTLTIGRASTAATLTLEPSWALYGETVLLTATVTVNSPGAGTPTGTITLMNGTTVLDTETVDADGSVTIGLSSLALGTHSLTVVYGGDNNFSSSTSEAAQLSISDVTDSTGPAVTLTLASITNSTQPTGNITVTDTESGVADGTAVYVDLDLNGDGDFTDDGETAYSIVSLSAGAATFQPTATLAEGTYYVRARTSDASGNEGTSAIATVVVDTTAPTLTVTAPSLTNNTQPTVSVSATDTAAGISEDASAYLDVDLNGDGDFSDDGETAYATLLLSGGQATYQPTTALADGAYYIRVRASDAAGNAGTSTTATVVVDTTGPTATINQADYQSDATTDSLIYFTITFSEEVSDFATGDVMLTGTAAATTATVTGSGTTYSVAVSGMYGAGSVIASLLAGIAHDAAGNASQASTSTDNQVQYSASLSQSFTLTGPTSNTYQSGDNATIEWTAGGVVTGSTISLCLDEDTTWDNGNEHWIKIDQLTAANGSGSLTWNTGAIETGTYYVAGYLWDGATTFTFSHLSDAITISGDWVAQSFTLTGPTSTSYSSGDDATIEWTTTGVVPGSTISLCLDEDTTWSNGNEHWIRINQVSATDGSDSLTWNTAAVQPGTYYLAGYMWDGGTTFSQSHLASPIVISGDWVAQSFELTALTSSAYEVGDTVDIEWTAGGVVPDSLISLCYDEDTTWNNGNEHWIEIDQVTALDGADFSTWDTTDVEPGYYYIAGYLWDRGTTFTTSHLTDYVTITAAQSLMAEADSPRLSTLSALTIDELTPIVAEAKNRLIAALGSEVADSLNTTTFQITDLPDEMLGRASAGTVTIDDDAAGYGWFVDPTPADDKEFSGSDSPHNLTADSNSAAYDRADLLTAVMHEMGHVLGYSDDSLDDLMDGFLPFGVRRSAFACWESGS